MLAFLFSFITWSAKPEIFEINLGGVPFAMRWYGLLFASGFATGFYIMAKVFAIEKKPEKDLDSLFFYMIVAVVLGARLGHCLFYEPDYFLSHPIEILYVWQGGLASHGALFTILPTLYFYSRSRPNQPFLWVADRISLTIPLGGAFIRLGNLMNSEIIGKPTDLSWGFIFTSVDQTPRHPAQLYEAISCLLLFGFLIWWYSKRKGETPHGQILGLLLAILFTLRFFYEFLKENQVDFESKLPLNMGQNLSIPAVLLGIYLIYSAKLPQKTQKAA
ncbi:MAG TPA: prolipoprotein diacylglyceryl transferase [Microscillaceae bacterium]|jgi:prolipoprotein diacylglyceryl transferase|nr:prolipoprotein diacylglyceryl transferase [Microscillaceae bacterium]